jgi:hypothetical protein
MRIHQPSTKEWEMGYLATTTVSAVITILFCEQVREFLLGLFGQVTAVLNQVAAGGM